MKNIICVSILILTACQAPTCEELRKRYFNQEGSYRIESVEGAEHTTALYGKHGERMLYVDDLYLAEPQIGDSIYKRRGTYTYILIKKDSSFAQFYDCDSNLLKADIIQTAWKNGDSVDLAKIIR